MPPRARHAGFPGYTSDSEPPAPLAWDWATARLRDARAYWIATTTSGGAPHAMPVWGVWHDGAVWFSTGQTSVKARNLARDPRVAVHLESADEAVILHGSVDRPAAEIADPVLDEYERKYELRPDAAPEAWFRLRPARAYAWRERDYPRSMTRFDF